MQLKSLLVVILLFPASLVWAQKKGALLNDKFKGNIALSGDEFANTTLSLKHERYADLGAFTLDEVFPGTKFDKPAHITTSGDWTVLKGSATDENATVVELNASGGRMLYFLRLKNGDLQQLDFEFHEMRPTAKHLLRKQ